MTKQEALTVSAYTGVLMTDFSSFHEYVEKMMGRPVFTHELGSKEFMKQLREATRPEFMKLCHE